MSSFCLARECTAGFGLVSRVCFQTLVETPPCSALAFTGLLDSLKSCGEFFLALKRLCDTKLIGLGFAIAKFIGLGFAIAEPSPAVSCPLFDMALCFLFERKKWLRENVERFIMFAKQTQPIQRDSLGSGHVSHRKTSAVHDHFDHCFIMYTTETRLEKNVCLWERGPQATTVQYLGFPFVWVWICDFTSSFLSRVCFQMLG